MKTRQIILELDEDDWDTIQSELARRQAFRDKEGPILPDGDSNMVGAILADSIRSLEEYRVLWELDHPRLGE